MQCWAVKVGEGAGEGTLGHSTVTTEPSAPMKVTMALPSALTSFLTFTTSLQNVSLATAALITVLPRLAATGRGLWLSMRTGRLYRPVSCDIMMQTFAFLLSHGRRGHGLAHVMDMISNLISGQHQLSIACLRTYYDARNMRPLMLSIARRP